MALLIDIGISGWMTEEELAEQVRAAMPEADVRTSADVGDPADVTMMAVVSLNGDRPTEFPNLQLVQKLGAGVETIVKHPGLPDHVRVTRLKPDAPAREIAEWFLAYILRAQRNMDKHDSDQAISAWGPIEPRYTPDTAVGVLGLGHIGSRSAGMLRDVGFQVKGWSRSSKQIEGVDCRHGYDALPGLLSECDFVCCILPSTPETVGLFDTDLLAALKPGAQLLNAGRGDLIDEAALMAALDAGQLDRAILDVVSEEPLPSDNPLWTHTKVVITPHVSGWHLGDALKDVAENYRRLSAGEQLLHEVDRDRGY
ncbi:2-hydroxyacid dehydrogenase [Falsiruegeria mediterranea]|uniref:Glyoxylate/hydroxypyruvate reductase A n=1 Tax=Falsiruegeria mediterranea M17 TaxID=1200281 RepID=A0A2R8C755_9RHOB|nr:glyoxylate/hydroxypyruvate reductase A [Falsiruegeria mediterranea]SPJ28183.1 Glyoxylate/hydroxypyruvate reductase A [Falsiruegeria mediterranea M17]